MGTIVHPTWKYNTKNRMDCSYTINGDDFLMREHTENREPGELFPNLVGLSGDGRFGPEHPRRHIGLDHSIDEYEDEAGRELWMVSHADKARSFTPQRFEGNKWCQDCKEVRMGILYARCWSGSSCVRCTRVAIVTIVRWLSELLGQWKPSHSLIVEYLIQLEVWNADGWNKFYAPSPPLETFAGLSKEQLVSVPSHMQAARSRQHFCLPPAVLNSRKP